ncbi:MAG: hypothetical protein KF699_15135 [Phycisphaeraceae bacterium]|nr:hypothetical protein [Phycisphaeraceae bacterium]MBX3407716.1 hypothetical protein [Phycisphaeraceae bacterium]
MSSEASAAASVRGETETNSAARRGTVAWVKRLGVAGFLFFFIKGMMWLIVPAAIVWWRSMSGGE